MKLFYQHWKNVLWGGLLFIGMSYLFSLLPSSFNFDLTASGLHTISKGSKEILRKLPEPVTFKLYYSKTAASKGSDQIRVFTTHFEYIKELLKLFESHSQNKVKLQVIDPRPDTTEEEEAVMAGLKKFQLTDTETYIFGLVAQAQSGSQKVIEFFDPNHADKLEYEISKLLTSLHQGNKKRLGILSAENLSFGREWWIGQILQDLYSLSALPKDLTEVKDVDVVFLYGTKGLEEKTLKALDQFLVNGGKVFLAADPKTSWNQDEASNLSVLGPLFKAWGVSVPEGKFAGDLKYAGMGRLNAFSPTQRLLPVFQCQNECLKTSESPSISALNQVTFIYPGIIEKQALPKELKFTTLVQTSPQGNSYKDNGLGFVHPQSLFENFKEGKGVIIGARLDGLFPAAYKETILPAERRPGALVLIADQDFLRNEFAFGRDFFGAKPVNDNVALLLNELDGLTGSPDLMAIRSRGNIQRPFTTIRKIQLEADQETLGKVAKINASITRFQSELASLAGKADQDNLGLIQSEGLRKQKELQQEIARLKSELREAKRAGREKVEQIGSILYFMNVALAPFFLALLYLANQKLKTKKYKLKGGKTYENYDNVQTV